MKFLVSGPGVDHNEILKIASRRVHTTYNFFEMTIHMEANQDPPANLQIDTPVEK